MQLIGFIVVGACISTVFLCIAATSDSPLRPYQQLEGSRVWNKSAIPLIVKLSFYKDYKFTKGCYGAHVQKLLDLQSAHWIMPADCFDTTSHSIKVYGYIENLQIPTNQVVYFAHPDYNDETKANNIAVVSVPYYLSADPTFDYIEMPSAKSVIDNEEVKMFKYNTTGLLPKKSLMNFKIDVINSIWCKVLYPMSPLKQNKLCASGWFAKGLREDDFGAPLIIRENQAFKMVGLVNIVRPWTYLFSYPIEFLSIDPYLDWIHTVIKSNSNATTTSKHRRTATVTPPRTNLPSTITDPATDSTHVTNVITPRKSTDAPKITTNPATTTSGAPKITTNPATTTSGAPKPSTNSVKPTTNSVKPTTNSVKPTVHTTKRPPATRTTTNKPATTESLYEGQDYSYSVTLNMIQNRTSLKICGGAQIGNEWVLTAAECLHEIEWNAIAFTYSGELVNYRRLFRPKIRVKFAIHPQYDPRTKANNLAVVKCDVCTVLEKYKIPTVPLEYQLSKTVEQEQAVTSAAMHIVHANKNYGIYVHPVKTKIVSAFWCKVAHLFSISNNYICASALYGRLPSAEIGAPLVVKGHLLGMIQVVGIGTSTGRWPSWIPAPLVFTRVEPYGDWIRNVTEIDKKKES